MLGALFITYINMHIIRQNEKASGYPTKPTVNQWKFKTTILWGLTLSMLRLLLSEAKELKNL